MSQHKDKTYYLITEYIENLSKQINNMYDIQPKIFLRFNQDDNDLNGTTTLTYRTSDMYIELNIPYNYAFTQNHKIALACILIHEYCHYIKALTLSGKARVNGVCTYTNNQKYRRAEEQRNWTATKRLAKKLGLWNKPFYKAAREYYYTTMLQF